MNDVTLTIEKIVTGGDGFAKHDGCAVFVPYTSPGDVIEAEITVQKKHFVKACLKKIIISSAIRTRPPCPYYFDPILQERYGKDYRYCGGCNFQHIAYPQQLSIKEAIVRETFMKVGGIDVIPLSPVQGMDEPWRYRNKIQLPVGSCKKKVLIGFFEPKTHRIIDIQNCLIQDALSTTAIETLRELIHRFGYRMYEENTNRGWLRHILIRTSYFSKKMFIILITRSYDFPNEKEFTRLLIQKAPTVAALYQNINPFKTNVILGKHTRKIWGDDYLEEKIGHVRYVIMPTAFFQVNPCQTEQLYETIKRLADPQGDETVFDLYCGSGGIGIFLGDCVRKVIGIDESFDSIESARMNAGYNHLTNCTFIKGDVDDFFKSGTRAVPFGNSSRRGQSPLLCILDPPRSGCSQKLLHMTASLQGRIIYVSCNPATLARDSRILLSHGYHLTNAVPVDMFPQTAHVEVVAVFDRR